MLWKPLKNFLEGRLIKKTNWNCSRNSYSGGIRLVAKADALWEIPDNSAEFSAWTEALFLFNGATDILGESAADGLRIYFLDGLQCCMPNALISSASGLFEITEDDKIYFETTS